MTQSPLPYETPVPGRIDVPTLASQQRSLMLCILAYIVCVILQFAVPGQLKLVFALLAFAASITGLVFVFMIATKIYSTGVGILLGILTLIPLIGLIVLLVVNSKATNILKANGYRVGLLGATPPGQ